MEPDTINWWRRRTQLMQNKRDRLHQSIKAASAILAQSDCTVCQQALAELESEVDNED